MARYYIDFETRSGLDLPKVGQYRYLRDPQADIVMMAWSDGTHPAKLWLPGAPVPFQLNADDKVYAFNIGFDRNVMVLLGKKYGLPYVAWEQCVDLMGLCARFGLPQNLDNACKVLKLKNQKLSKIGKRLMNKICLPPFEYTQDEFREFVRYGLADTDALIEMAVTLPVDSLSPSEQQCWVRTQKQNERGVLIDIPMARRVAACVKVYKDSRNKYLSQITEGALQTAGQVAKIREYCQGRGVTLHDLTKQTVTEALADPELDVFVRRVLEVRQIVSATSVKKFDKVLGMVGDDNRLHNLLVYHAASTGRYSSRGLQIHNLLRAAPDDTEALVQSFMDGSVFKKNVVEEAKLLVRAMLTAPKDHMFIISDFGSIEYVVCCWLAGDAHHLHEFANGKCPYKSFGADLFNKHYDSITKEERQQSKPGVLGGIYSLSGNGYVEYAKGYGLNPTEEDGAHVIRVFRNKYKKIKKLWYELKDIAMCAVMNPDTPYTYGRIQAKTLPDQTGTTWLALRLPSGRSLFYYDPVIKPGKYGDDVTHMGIDSTTQKWVRKVLSITRLVENVTQATARDLLTHCEDEIEKLSGVFQVFSCHDETVTECNVTHLKLMKGVIHKIMSTPPKWANNLPLRAETFVSRRYTKG